MEDTAASLQKFFCRECNAEEAAQTAAWLESHEEALDPLFLEEWEQTEPATDLQSDESMAMYTAVERHAGSRARWIRLGGRTAAAACLTGILALGILHSGKRKPEAEIAGPVLKRSWEVRANSLSRDIRFQLADGSTVSLRPHSSIRYLTQQDSARDIYLQGTASFTVARDRDRPFTVYMGEVATTALGTAFRVAGNSGKITVRLFEGKVKIKLETAAHPEIFLNPGQELRYERATRTFSIHLFTGPAKTQSTAAPASAAPAPVDKTENWYAFENEPVSEVFHNLEAIYNIRIRYQKNEMRNVYFIGRFEKTDSAEHILANIALLKHLRLRKQGNTYTISK